MESSMTKNKWQSLLERMTIVDTESPFPCSAENLSEFEQKWGIFLPEDYKEFLQTFGAGILGYDFYIADINDVIPYDLQDKRTFYKEILQMREEGVKASERQAFDRIRSLLDNALIFCTTSSGIDFLFDLNSYGLDKRCDIYVFSTGRGDFDLHCFGRDFYTFVCDYLLGMKSYDSLPKNLRPNDISEVYDAFTPYVYPCIEDEEDDGEEELADDE
jgi:hypothetical protein